MPTISKFSSASAGAASQVSVATTAETSSSGVVAGAYAVAACTNGSGDLEVIAWNVVIGQGPIPLTRVGSATASKSTKNVAITGLDSNRVVTAHVDSAGALSVNVFVVGAIEYPGGGEQQPLVWFQNGTTGGSATAVSIDALSSKEVVTAVRDKSGNLRVDAWSVSPGVSAGGTGAGLVNADGSEVAGAVSDVAITGVTSSQAVTAFVNDSGNLQVIVWAIGGGKVTRPPGGSATGSAVKQVSITTWAGLSLEGPVVVTAAINTKGNHELAYWNASSSGSIGAGNSATAGPASQVAVCSIPHLGNPVTAICGNSSELDVEVWGNLSGGEIATFNSTSSPISAVAVASEGYDSGGNGYFVTAARDSKSGNLEVEVWSYKP
jgi:hypothetical protein